MAIVSSLFSRPRRLLPLLVVAGAVQAAELPKVRSAAQREPIVQAAAAGAPTEQFRRIAALPLNEKIGTVQSGWFCGTSVEARSTPNFNTALGRELGSVAARELQAAGYPRPPAQESVFAQQQPQAQSDYEVGVRIKEIQLYVCERDKVAEGGFALQLAWELFSPRLQRTVYSLTTEGSAEAVAADKQVVGALVRKAVTVAVQNLLADPGFSERARRPADQAPVAEVAPAAAQARLRVALLAGSDGAGAQERMPQLQSAVVTLQTGAGSGSGFYIDASGYLLTNQHVVGDAKFLKVKLATGRDLVGEVLRSDKARDVALVKTEPVSIASLTVRPDDVQTGEDVYAIGSPLGETFATTVTRGVISGTRMVQQQRWLQSDVAILPGSSGGPLIGRHGAVIGMTSRGINQGNVGVNLFVPIREALEALGIEARSE